MDIKKLRTEYEKSLKDAFEEELQAPEKIVNHVRLAITKGVGALMGLRLDSWGDKWEISHSPHSNLLPFQTTMQSVLTELIEEHREELKKTVAEVLASKGFINEIKSEYRHQLMARVKEAVDHKARDKAERLAREIIGDED